MMPSGRGAVALRRGAALRLVALALVLAAGTAAASAAEPLSARVRTAVEHFVLERAPAGATSVLVPSLDGFALPGVDPAGVEILLSAGSHERFRGDVPVTVVLRSGALELKRAIVTARIQSTEAVLVTTRALTRGTLIRAADVAIERRERRSVPRGALALRSEAVGRHARNSLKAGTVLRETNVELRPVVARGQVVRLVFAQGGLRIDASGRAREDGHPGDTIRVQNVTSRRDVLGFVDPDGVVHVQ